MIRPPKRVTLVLTCAASLAVFIVSMTQIKQEDACIQIPGELGGKLGEYLSPYDIEIGGAKVLCGWATAQTVYRSCTVVLTMIVCIVSLVLNVDDRMIQIFMTLATGAMYGVFALDCDRVRSGAGACDTIYANTQASCVSTPYIITCLLDLLATGLCFASIFALSAAAGTRSGSKGGST